MENGEASSDVISDDNAGDPPQPHAENADDPRDSPRLKSDPSVSKTPRKRSAKKARSADPASSDDDKAVLLTSERPARERKSIERFSDSIEKEKVKEFRILQGKGTCLKDIPNVALKLSKRKRNDEYLHLLHKLFYGKRAKANVVKANVLKFSGCVWGINEEKEKAKMKERLEKCVKESLLHLTDILDLPMPKATTKKEEIVLQLLEFFDSPHKTTDKLLGEEEQKEKGRRKSANKGRKRTSSGGRPSKKHKVEDTDNLNEEDEDEDEDESGQEEEAEELKSKNRRMSKKSAMSTSKKAVQAKSRRKSTKSEETDEGDEELEENEDPKSTSRKTTVYSSEEPEEDDEEEPEEGKEEEEPEEHGEEKPEQQNKEETEEEEHEPNKSSDRKQVSKSTSKASNSKPVKTKSVYDPEEDLEEEMDMDGTKSKSLKKVSKKQKTEEVEVTSSKGKKGSTTRKKGEKVERVAKTKKAAPKKAEEETELSSVPSDDDLRAAICELLRDADFSKVTFTDVVKQLGGKFNMDLAPHKAHVKLLIQEEISKLVDDEDDGEDEEPEQDQVAKG